MPSPVSCGWWRPTGCASRRSPRIRGSSTTRSTASWNGSPTSSARAGTASSWLRPRTHASWYARGAPGSRRSSTTPDAVFAEPGTASLVAVGQSLPFRRGGSVALPLDVSRTLEDFLERTELDFVHVHEPFAPSAASAALRHSRALNVGSFHGATERLLSTQVARRVVELLFGRLDGRTASFTVTRELLERYFPGDYRLILPAPTCFTGPRRTATPLRRSCSRPRRSAARSGSSCEPCGGCRPTSTGGPRSGSANPATAPGGLAAAAPAGPGAPRRAGRRVRGAAPCARADRRGGVRRIGPGAPARAAGARRRRGARGGASAPVRGGAARRRARPAVRAA